ncbi:hypothetical protein O181_007930 [Austropuccinia psidii MF-1]|uniref:Uncharacterized protein n=1 Tax=Austropuccinia psidii MF-1 TaxID=1389203 RepID=A0A9Q3BND7_9BASI|nr:hypothetical protein [Austropuccinia psidii MF-1]
MSPVHLRDLGVQRHQPEEREGLSRARRPGRGHLGHSGGWKYIEGNHNHSSIPIPIQQKPSNRGLEGYGSNYIRLTRSRPNQLSIGFTPFRNRPISGQVLPFFTIPRGFQEKTRIQGQKQDHLKPKEEGVISDDPEAIGFDERSAQEPEVVVHNSRVSSLINRNITPTHIENNVVTPQSNLNSDSLWSQRSQFAEKTQNPLSKLEASHERMKKLTASMDKIVKPLQEGHSQLRKASEETNKRLNLVFEEQHHRKGT